MRKFVYSMPTLGEGGVRDKTFENLGILEMDSIPGRELTLFCGILREVAHFEEYHWILRGIQ